MLRKVYTEVLTACRSRIEWTMRKRVQRENFDYQIVDHCNLRCAHCDHLSPALAKRCVDVDDFYSDLCELAKHAHARHLQILGGEPLLHPDILSILDVARRSRIADRLVLATNGLLLRKQGPEFWERVDVVRLSRYPGVDIRMRDRDLRDLCERNEVELWSIPQPDFYPAFASNPIGDAATVQSVFDECTMAHSCHTIHNRQLHRCSRAPFVNERLKLLGLPEIDVSKDALDLRAPDIDARTVRDLLKCSDPLEACKYCLGCSAAKTGHRMIPNGAYLEHLKEPDPTSDLRTSVARRGFRKALRALS